MPSYNYYYTPEIYCKNIVFVLSGKCLPVNEMQSSSDHITKISELWAAPLNGKLDKRPLAYARVT